MRTVHPGKTRPKSSGSNHSLPPNIVGRQLVAQEQRRRFSHVKIYIASIVLGFLIGLTISGFWSSLINRCTACGKFGAEAGHRRTIGPEGPAYYWCQPEERSTFFIPPPGQNSLEPLMDDR